MVFLNVNLDFFHQKQFYGHTSSKSNRCYIVRRSDRKKKFMVEVNKDVRPLSPHLSIYRPQLTSITSILTRITGNALIVGAILVVWWLFSAAISPQYFAIADAVMTSWFGKLIMLGSVWALWYHTLAGVRHLIWDNAIGLDLKTAYTLGWCLVVGSVLLTIVTVIVL